MNDELTDLDLIHQMGDTFINVANAIKGLADNQAELQQSIFNLHFKMREIELNLNKHLRGVE